MDWDHIPRVRIAAALLRAGEVVAYPTEAVWGLGCDPLNGAAVSRILDLKGRALDKGLILIAANAKQLLPFIDRLDDRALASLGGQRPVPTTWLVPASLRVPHWLTGGRRTIAVRVTGHPVAAALCRVFGGPIVSTSANPQGMPPARSGLKVRQYFRQGSVHILAGALGRAARPSEIRDLATGNVIREG